MKSPYTKNTLLQAAASQSTKQSLQESIFSSTLEKLRNKKFPSLQKNKTLQPHSPRQTDANFNGRHLATQHLRALHGDTGDRKTEALGGNIGLPAMAGTVVNSAFVHLKNFRAWGQVSASKPPLRQAKNR